MKTPDYYTILNVTPTASSEQIKAAFRQMAMKFHPDKSSGQPGSSEYFLLVRDAYEILGNGPSRKAYDARRSLDLGSIPQPRGRPVPGDLSTTVKAIFVERLNFLLWNAEDYLRSLSGFWSPLQGAVEPSESVFVEMLLFYDRWLLGKFGVTDPFFESRVKSGLGPAGYRSQVMARETRNKGPTLPVREYFYNIRRRTDELIAKFRIDDLKRVDQQSGLTLGALWLKVERHLNSLLFNATLGPMSAGSNFPVIWKDRWVEPDLDSPARF